MITPIIRDYDRSAMYQCNQAIYSPRCQQGLHPTLETVSPQRPLRCVLYNENPVTNAKFADWLNGMRTEYDLREVRLFEVNTIADEPGHEDNYVVYEFVPKTEAIEVAEAPEVPLRR